jgi:hypothetical protein
MILVPLAESRSMRDALRVLRNKWTLSGNALTVYAEDGTTVAADVVYPCVGAT